MNYALINAVRAQVLAEPQFVNMAQWCSSVASIAEGPVKKKDCGTVGCIAGHTLLAVGIRPKVIDDLDLDVSLTARHLLDLSPFEAEQLFYFMNSYDQKQDDYFNPYADLAKQLKKQRAGSERYAKIVAKAIDLCIDRHNNKVNR